MGGLTHTVLLTQDSAHYNILLFHCCSLSIGKYVTILLGDKCLTTNSEGTCRAVLLMVYTYA